jgi:hypothetical protein
MSFTDPQAWLEAHELIECKPLKGRWTRETCIEISKKMQKSSGTQKSMSEARIRTLPCVNCPILAALEE